MHGFSSLARVLIVFGSIIFGLGVLFLIFEKIPFIGKLPGDIYIEKKNFKFYFPLTTSIIISIILTILFRLFSRR